MNRLNALRRRGKFAFKRETQAGTDFRCTIFANSAWRYRLRSDSDRPSVNVMIRQGSKAGLSTLAFYPGLRARGAAGECDQDHGADLASCSCDLIRSRAFITAPTAGQGSPCGIGGISMRDWRPSSVSLIASFSSPEYRCMLPAKCLYVPISASRLRAKSS